MTEPKPYRGHIRLKGLVCEKAAFEQILFPSDASKVERLRPDLRYEFAVQLQVTEREEEGVSVELAIRVEADENVPQPYNVEVRYRGDFSFGELPEGLSRVSFARTNAAAILFPYVRETISSLTSRGSAGPLILPPVNVVALLERTEPKTENQA